MSVILILIGASLSVAIIFLFAFIKSVRTGQFDDVSTPPYRIINDDEINNSNI